MELESYSKKKTIKRITSNDFAVLRIITIIAINNAWSDYGGDAD